MEERNIDNDVFMAMAEANSNAKKQRIKGYYICPSHGEFIKAIPMKQTACPFCNRKVDLLLKMDSVMEQTTIAIWKDGGYYSDVRADIKKERRKVA